MSDVNRTILGGRLTADPEVINLQSGVSKTSFRFASNRTFGSGENRKEKTVFIEVTAWRKLGEWANKYLKKGMRVIVDGQLEQRSWDGPDGKPRSVISLEADNISFADSKPANREEDQPEGPF